MSKPLPPYIAKPPINYGQFIAAREAATLIIDDDFTGIKIAWGGRFLTPAQVRFAEQLYAKNQKSNEP